MLAWFALHLAQVLFTLARDLFNFGLGSLHSAQVLFTLARDLFNHHHYQPSHHIIHVAAQLFVSSEILPYTNSPPTLPERLRSPPT